MTQEDKELLLKDLSARLPYGVKVRTNRGPEIIEGLAPFCHNQVKIALNLDWSLSISDYTPYLRPMSSMTEEEKQELERLSEEYFGKALDKQIQESLSSSNKNESRILEYIASSVIVDWLNKHHFDYRGLIEKGLALEAPEGMYK